MNPVCSNTVKSVLNPKIKRGRIIYEMLIKFYLLNISQSSFTAKFVVLNLGRNDEVC